MMFGNVVPLTTVNAAQVLPGTVLQTGNILPTTTVGNNDVVIIQDTTNQAELINQLQNHINENQQILIITDDQGQDQYIIIDKDQDINALLQDGSLFNHYTEQQQFAQISTGLQQQILQIASMPTIQTAHTSSVVSTPVPIQPKPTPKPIAPATMNPSLIPHKQSFQSKVNANAFHIQNVEESIQRVTAPPPKRKPIEIRYDPKDNSFHNAFLKFLAGEKPPSLEAIANEPIIRKPKDNIYIGAVNAGIILNSLGQQTGTMGYQTYIVNDESRMEEIMVIGRPLYDDTKGVKINPLLKNLPTNNQTTNFVPQSITLTPNSQQQNDNQQQQQQQQYINTLTDLFRNAQTVPNILNNSTTITLPQDILNQLSAGTLTLTQTSNGTDAIESATASAAAILSQLNEMVQEQQQQQTNQNTMNYISNELLSTTNSNRIQSEKATTDALLLAALSKTNNTNKSHEIHQPSLTTIQSDNTNSSSTANTTALYDSKHEQLQLANAALQQQVIGEHSQSTTSTDKHQQETSVSTAMNQSIATTTEGNQFADGEMGPEIPFEMGQFLLYKGHFLNLLHFPIWKVHTKTLLLKYDTVLADSEIAWEATDEGMFYTNVYEDYVPLKCELKGLHNNQEVVRIINESHPIKLKIHGHMSSVRIQHDVYAQVLVNHVYDADVLPRIKANTDEYATYIRLIDEILEQRYNYVIQSRRTIETFPCAVAKYPLLDIIAQPQRQLHCQVTEDKSQSVSHTLRFHGNQYDVDTLKASETPLQILEIFVCENIAILAQTAHQLKHHVYHMFCHAQQKVAELQALNPTADATELISAICSDTTWLQELFDRFDSIMQQADTYIFSNVDIAW